MKRTSKTEPAANTGSSPLTPVTTAVVRTLTEQAPRIREENRKSVLPWLPDELVREIGKYLTLREWVALRQLCKACAEQVDRQPPFTLLEPDVRTDKLFQKFLRDATPEYAVRLGNLIAELYMSTVTKHDKFEKILEAIGNAQAWELIKIENCASGVSGIRLAAFCGPLLQGLNRVSGTMKRKLEYFGWLEKDDRALVEEVQRSSSLQLTTLKTNYLDEFLPFIAANTEFSNLELDLNNSATLTRETFKALQRMQGSVKCMTLSSMVHCDASEIFDAMKNKGRESLTLRKNRSDNGVDLRPWLTPPLSSLTLDTTRPDASTFAEAIGISRTLRVLDIRHVQRYWVGSAPSPAWAGIDILLPALRMNQSIERLLLIDLDCEIFSFLPAELLDVILNHPTIMHLEWSSAGGGWPMLAAPESPKAMDHVFLEMRAENMIGIAYLLQRLASLKYLGLEINGSGGFNWEFLSIVSRLGVDEFSLFLAESDRPTSSIPDAAIPIENCFWHGLRRLALEVYVKGYKAVGMAAGLGSATTLTSLQLIQFDCIGMGKELIEGLMENQSLERIELVMHVREENKYGMQIDITTAEIIEAIFNHPNISHAKLDFDECEWDRPVYLPPGYAELLKRLKPTLKFVLSPTTEILPIKATPEEIEAVSDTYERIVKAAASRTLHS